MKTVPSEGMWRAGCIEMCMPGSGRGHGKPVILLWQGVRGLLYRTFVKQREVLNSHKDLKSRVDDLEKKYDGQFQVVFKAIKALIVEKPKGNQGHKRFDV